MKYNPNEIEPKWQKYWADNQIFKAENHTDKEKFYVLDMFPYPSGAGLHVGHPLGYIASDIVARYKRHKGFNVLHPQGYDSFGLPAEQYAIQTGQHPAITTETNIKRYREQLDKIGFSFDWSREVRTSEPEYYKWTQWIFIQLFNSYYCKDTDQARPIDELIQVFEVEGNHRINAVCDDDITIFSADEWKNFSDEEKQRILLKYRLTYLAETEVNWCPALGTVLANDEIVNGVSERGGHPVIRKKMTQWSMRISAYAERLLQGLETIDWTESLKESQRNWIGKSVGAEVEFKILPLTPSKGGGTETVPNYMTGGNNSHLLINEAKRMRKEPTETEDILWQELRNNSLGDKFRRQHLIDDFIVDFVCLSKKIVVEVDGGYHSTPEQKEYDEQRTIILNKRGFKVIRFTNEEVSNNLQSVLQKIKSELKAIPAPLSFGEGLGVRVFTTRPDTIFGVSFMTLAPEHELVKSITTPEQKQAVEAYIEATAKRSERERMADVKTISGVFTGAYAEHPFTKEPIPIWIGDYVLAGYGTGAVMAVPCGDERDYAFAKHFGIEIKNIFNQDISEQAFTEKGGFEFINSDFLNGLDYKAGTAKIIEELEKIGAGKAKVNYRLRDAVFSRQRYWGEPFPVYYVNGMPQMIDEKYLPIRLPEVEKYLPTEDGQPPLGNAKEWYWNTKTNSVCSPPSEGLGEDIFPLELNTMPGWAGSSWYWLRYMDAQNESEFASEEAINYWQNVDLYIGGSEHATGHLLYSRFWNKFLKDRGLVPTEEPFQKLINQGMILGNSAFVYRTEDSKTLISKNQIGNTVVHPIHVDLSVINDVTNELDIDKFKAHPLYQDYKDAEFILDENRKYIVGREVEKMSKSKYNVVNPDDICEEYGADTLRLYEMFLGPLEQAKPWNTAGITGVFGFLKKLWRLYFDDNGLNITDEEPTKEMYKSLHKTIKKATEDIENFSFNTSVSQFMICVNELSQQKCHHRAILEPLAVLISPYAPHIAEELWSSLGHEGSISKVPFPKFEEKYLVESSKEYPVSFNGKMRFTINLPLDLSVEEIEKIILADNRTQEQLQGREPKKVIIVPGKIINLVG
ncbi:leucine--tRNA ligase [Avrilella dinanensis]|uniref:Leucine--tRNA ligase n=1 Tax=Avrilella dinanensis TaxID=2008672 RepID=A0A2M9R2Z2_9FLAO|nr:leucine--tRNA ligase [Avrilella dinanensis]PJR03219.1 leucine--tRNA ligase [Avrilella dinanensis]